MSPDDVGRPVTVTPRRAATILALAAAVGAGACTGGDEGSPITTGTTSTTTSVPARPEDGRLVLGVLLPTNDPLVGEPLLAAVEQARDEMNGAGGVLDRRVELVVADETAEATAPLIDTFLSNGVDAVIGPASSLVALRGLGELVDERLLTCSPTASALALDGFPDRDLFFRTMPSDSMQADVIADLAEVTGSQNAVIAHIDDAYGRDYASATSAALRDRAIELVDVVPFAGRDEDFSLEAEQVAAASAGVIVVLGTGQDSARFLAALDGAEVSERTQVFVNGDIRSPDAQPLIAALRPEFRGRITGVSPQAQADTEDEPWMPDGPYAVNAYDCANLLALSAQLAGSTDGVEMAAQIPGVSAGGSACVNFPRCKASLEDGLNVNYNGPSGVSEISRSGETVRANFETFTFDANGSPVHQRSFPHSP